MKKAEKTLTNLQALEAELKLVEDEIKELETNIKTKELSYMNGRPYTEGEVYGSSSSSHGFSLMMTEADKSEIRLGDLKKIKKVIEQQIEEEKALQVMAFGG